MKIEKRGNSYRVRKMYMGKMYSITFNHKPTQKEILQKLSEELNQIQRVSVPLTFNMACEEYYKLKDRVVSPSTIGGYRSIQRNLSAHFKNLRLSDITQLDVQREINEYSKTRSPKTVRNASGFISAIIKEYYPNTTLSIRLPQKEKKEPYIPTTDEVQRILEYSAGGPYEIALTLAAYGLRKSEICALNVTDLNGNALTINKSLVLNSKNEFVLKSTKTTDSERTIYISDDLADKIQAIGSGRIYKQHPGNILKFLNRAQDALGIQRFQLHKMRHYFCSVMSGIVPEEDVLALGGWSSPYVMKAVYRHSMIKKDEQAKREAAEKYHKILSNNLSNNSETPLN